MGGEPPPEPFPAVKSDLKFITCSTCKTFAKRLHTEMSKWDKKVTGSEEAIHGNVLGLCDVHSKAGSWIAEYDMVESKDGKAIELKRQSSEGECEIECNTIAAACKEVLQDASLELAAGLYMSFNPGKKKNIKPFDLKALTSRLCTSDDAWAANVDGGCSAGVPKVPKKRTAGPVWKPLEAPPGVPEVDPVEPGVGAESAAPDASKAEL